MEVILRKYHGSLWPVDERGDELIARLRDRRDVECNIIARRNPRHHRLYFAILKLLATHCATFENADPEIISDSVKIATGLVRTYVDQTTGQTIMRPLSIAWAAMDQARFNLFFDKACETIAARWLKGSSAAEVRAELYRMVDGDHAIGERVAEFERKMRIA